MQSTNNTRRYYVKQYKLINNNASNFLKMVNHLYTFNLNI